MGGVRGGEVFEKPINDPDYPDYFPAGENTGFRSDTGTITARQGNSVKVLKLSADTTESTLDIRLKPLAPAKGLKPLLDLFRP